MDKTSRALGGGDGFFSTKKKKKETGGFWRIRDLRKEEARVLGGGEKEKVWIVFASAWRSRERFYLSTSVGTKEGGEGAGKGKSNHMPSFECKTTRKKVQVNALPYARGKK